MRATGQYFRTSLRRLGTITDWYESRIVIDRKSKFQARHVPLSHPDEIPSILQQFLQQHRKLTKSASHPHIIAWRTGDLKEDLKSPAKVKKGIDDQQYKNVQQGFNDNGEKGAGSKLLEHLVQHNIINKLIIVTRWYGGSPLGPLRFRHITNTSFDSLRKAEEDIKGSN